MRLHGHIARHFEVDMHNAAKGGGNAVAVLSTSIIEA